jgi:L-cystine transport system substrate-binding protein
MKKGLVSLILLAGIAIVGVGCSSQSSTTSSASKVKVIKIAGVNDAQPFTYIDDNGNLSGYDGDVLQAINKLLPQYKFEYSGMDQSAMLLGVEAGKYDIGTCHLYKTTDREEKFLFPDEPSGLSDLRVVTKTGRNDINSLSDLVGKKLVPIPSNDARYNIVEDYNEAHPDKQIKLESIDTLSAADTFKMVASGQYDAALYPAPAFASVENSLHLDIKLAGSVGKIPTYFVLNKKDTELKTQIDQALKELKQNGTLKKLAIKWYGEDVYKN